MVTSSGFNTFSPKPGSSTYLWPGLYKNNNSRLVSTPFPLNRGHQRYKGVSAVLRGCQVSTPFPLNRGHQPSIGLISKESRQSCFNTFSPKPGSSTWLSGCSLVLVIGQVSTPFPLNRGHQPRSFQSATSPASWHVSTPFPLNRGHQHMIEVPDSEELCCFNTFSPKPGSST